MTLIQRLALRARVELYRVKSGVLGLCTARRYRAIKDFCLFIGYPRSGHTLIASLLDAHPDIMMGMEWGALTYAQLGFGREQLFYSLVQSSALYNRRHKNTWTGYSYYVPGGWQGRYRKLRVIGDKFGGKTSMILHDSPQLLNQFSRTIKIRLRLLHIIRNPFDMITTSALRSHEKAVGEQKDSELQLLPFIQVFFERADVINDLKLRAEFEMLDIYHEDFIEDPKEWLKVILDFIGVDADEDYYTKCASIVFPEPHKSRFEIVWKEDTVSYVEKKLTQYPFLKHYRHNDSSGQ